MSTVAAVIPHWNRRDLLSELLCNLRRQTRPFDEVIIADNGSTDDSRELAASLGARVIHLERNFGFAAAVNRGVQSTQADWVSILNNDVTLNPDWLATLLEAVEHQNAWFGTGKILRANDPSVLDGTFDELSLGACACRCGAGKPDSPFWNRPRRVQFTPMTAILMRRALFQRVGPLDESFGSYLEDVDFGLRCAVLGLDGVYAPSAVAYHKGSATLGKWSKDTVALLSRNQVLLTRKHFSGQNWRPILAGQLLWGLLALRNGRGLSYLRGKVSGVKAARVLSLKDAGPQAQERVRSLVTASESQILEVQRQTGFDRYWRAYFWLLRR